MVILVDTREQLPWALSGPGVRLRRATLKAGDYSILGASGRGGVILERKSLADLFGTMSAGLERFRRELDRIAAVKPRFAAVVVEATEAEVRAGPPYGMAHGPSVLRLLFRECLARGVAVVLAGDRAGAERYAMLALQAFHETRKPV